jgi:hypothetical protein
MVTEFSTYVGLWLGSWVSGIYVNKNVKLDDLQVYGFDYDYTLLHYSDHLQCLVYDLAKKHLVNEVSPSLALHGLFSVLLD